MGAEGCATLCFCSDEVFVVEAEVLSEAAGGDVATFRNLHKGEVGVAIKSQSVAVCFDAFLSGTAMSVVGEA